MEKTIEFEARPKIWGFWNWRARPTPSPRFIEIPANVHVTARETYRVTLAPVESEPLCPPLCPVCGKPAGEHRGGLFCCGQCGSEAELKIIEPMLMNEATRYAVMCADGDVCTGWAMNRDYPVTAWNRRA